ncbi:MAG: LPXTG cell wall anchor domain-containing protein [Jatrophihabitantaceae bacterium]
MAAATRLLAGLALIVATVLGGAGSAAATAVPIGQCTTSSGVVLAVDFSHWGGPLLRSCGTTPTTGYQLLNQGGWHTQGTVHDGPGFICRIGYSGYQGGAGYPTSDPCQNTPPTSAYWSYWHANPGQSGWTYSQAGAANYSSAPGSVEAWTFGGSGSSPGFTPDAVRAQNSSPAGGPSSAPAPHTSAPAGSGGAGSSGGAGGAGGSGGGSIGTGSTSTGSMGGSALGAGTDSGMHRGPATTSAGKPTRSSAHRTSVPATVTSPSASAGPTASGLLVQDADPAAPATRATGSATPALLTVGILAVLGAGAGYLGWRRRQAG